jgi:hypothetical protein
MNTQTQVPWAKSRKYTQFIYRESSKNNIKKSENQEEKLSDIKLNTNESINSAYKTVDERWREELRHPPLD